MSDKPRTFEEWALENGYPYLAEDSQGRAAKRGYRAHDEDLAAKDRRIAELEGIDKACDAANRHVLELERDRDAAVELRTKEAATLLDRVNFSVEDRLTVDECKQAILDLLTIPGTAALVQHDAEIHQSYQSGEAWTRHEAALADKIADKVNQAVLAERNSGPFAGLEIHFNDDGTWLHFPGAIIRLESVGRENHIIQARITEWCEQKRLAANRDATGQAPPAASGEEK